MAAVRDLSTIYLFPVSSTWERKHLAGGGGGGGVLTPNFGRYVPRQSKVKYGQGLQNELLVERENAGLRNELQPFWAWNAGLRNELDPFWAWKCESPELPGRVWLTRGAAECFAFGLSRPWEAMNGLKLKKFWKWWSPERQNPPTNVKMVMFRNGFFIYIFFYYMLQNGNSGLKMGGLSRGTYPICIHMEVPPPPPREAASDRQRRKENYSHRLGSSQWRSFGIIMKKQI